MGIPQVSDRMKMAPVQALRAVFAAVGRILLTADRPEGRAATTDPGAGAGQGDHPRTPANAVRAGYQASVQQAGPAGQAGARWRDLDKTGNVRLLSAEDMELEFGIARPTATPPRDSTPPAGVETDALHGKGTSTPTVAVPELPLAGYDDLSLASIRARLRNLDTGQLRVLADYERSHAERADVLGMFERRIEKLEAGG
jgi:hypothetical protein